MNGDWSLQITTDGGLTGRGLGSARLSSDGASKSHEAVSRAVDAAAPGKWQSSYVLRGNERGYADQVLYRLTLIRDGKQYSTSWYDESRAQLPVDLAALFDAAWRAR